ncbi:hypothetical protein ACFXG6_05000 [Streptomyces roseus]|uniref:hypothetical protein n=1 Tax=Streptomyces roseus TaxID=66430 RepID=UPI003691518E
MQRPDGLCSAGPVTGALLLLPMAYGRPSHQDLAQMAPLRTVSAVPLWLGVACLLAAATAMVPLSGRGASTGSTRSPRPTGSGSR